MKFTAFMTKTVKNTVTTSDVPKLPMVRPAIGNEMI